MVADENLGTLDILARGQKSLDELSGTIAGITNEIDRVSDLFAASTKKINKAWAKGGKLPEVLTILKSTAKELDGPAERVEVLAQRFAHQLYNADKGVQILIKESTAVLNDPNSDPAAINIINSTFTSLRELATITSVSSSAMQGYTESMTPLAEKSGELRRPLDSLKKGVERIIEAKETTDNWVALMPSS